MMSMTSLEDWKCRGDPDPEPQIQGNFYTTASVSNMLINYNENGTPKIPLRIKSVKHVKARARSQRNFSVPLWDFDPFIYRVNDGQGVGPLNPMTILHEVFHERGWKEFGTDELKMVKGNIMGWNLCWRTNFTSQITPRTMFTWQFTNNIPRAIGFCNKEYLARYIHCMKEVYGSIFDFSPITYMIPRDMFYLESEHDGRSGRVKHSDPKYIEKARNLCPCYSEEQRAEGRNFMPVWISKPVGKSQGRGIIVANDVKSLAGIEEPSVVQEYIVRPLLIGGHKFDLRIYVVVASAFPLSIYVYNEGLTRFATDKYDITNLTNTCSHLTNVSINKLSPEYEKDKELIGQGCKWDFRRLRQYFKQQESPDWYMWQRIISIIVLSLVGEANRGGYVPYTKNCFEFLGYDILLDEDMRPWLLEVNHCPGLNGDCDVDFKVKNPMLHDLFNLLGLPILDPNPKETPRCSTPARPETARTASPPEFETTMKPLSFIDKYLNSNNAMPKYQPRLSLKNRLLETTAIYTQDLSKIKRPITADLDKPKKKKSARRPQPPSKKEIDESISSKEKRPFKPRDWTKPIKQCGGWVRVFPFDEMTTEQCKGRLGFDVQLIVNRIYCCLKHARQVTLDKPGHTDEFYNFAYKTTAKLSGEVWLPPAAPPSEKWESKIITPTPVYQSPYSQQLPYIESKDK